MTVVVVGVLLLLVILLLVSVLILGVAVEVGEVLHSVCPSQTPQRMVQMSKIGRMVHTRYQVLSYSAIRIEA